MNQSRRPVCRTLTVVLLLALSNVAFGQSAFFDFPRTPDELLVDYSQIHGKVAEADRVTTIQIFGDGMVRMHRPFWQIAAGDFTLHLDETELQDLLGELLSGGAFHFDAAAVHEACREVDAARLAADDVELGTSDDTHTRLRVRVTSLQAPDSAFAEGPIDHRADWRNLEWHAETYPQVSALKELSSAEKALHRLWDRDDLLSSETAEEVAP